MQRDRQGRYDAEQWAQRNVDARAACTRNETYTDAANAVRLAAEHRSLVELAQLLDQCRCQQCSAASAAEHNFRDGESRD
jgi:hypothetical protein